jgi:hypothetical protein
MIREEARLINMIILSVVTAIIVTFTGFANFGIAQGQVNNNSTSLTPEQQAAIRDPNNPSSKLDFVNTTESRICGIPKTVINTTTEEAANTTTTIGTETPSSFPDTSIGPSDSTSSSSPTITPTTTNQSPLYEQGYAKGVADAKSIQSRFPPSTTMTPDQVDCDSSIDPQISNEEYCSGYQHGFADTNNNALSGK